MPRLFSALQNAAAYHPLPLMSSAADQPSISLLMTISWFLENPWNWTLGPFPGSN